MDEMSGERQLSMAVTSIFPGFKFSPNDEELIYYLKKKLQGSDQSVDVISELEICKHEPWDLPAKSVFPSDNEWFFFSPLGRKYPNGSQSKRATESGYWKATGKERDVKSGSNVIGMKRTLVFHKGRAPNGERTEWKIHEFCMSGKSQDSMVVCRLRKDNNFDLSDTPRKAVQIKDTPRKGSLNQRDLSSGNNSTFDSSEIGIEQTGMCEGANAVDFCSKDCSSSYNPPSVEQIDSGPESDEKLKNEFSQHNSSSHQKDCDDEDDCFAGIINDDIVKLDESLLLPTTPDLLPMIATESEAERNSMQPLQAKKSHVLAFQGTANRRLRLKRRKARNSHSELVEAFAVVNENYPVEGVIRSDSQQSPKCLISMLSDTAVNRQSICVLLVILTLLVLFLSLLGGSWHVKRYAYATLF